MRGVSNSVAFDFQVDRKKEISPRKHNLKALWRQPDGLPDAGKAIIVGLPSHDDFPPLMVTEAVGAESDQTIFRFSGGAVVVARTTGKLASKDKLICPHDGPDVVVTLDRSP